MPSASTIAVPISTEDAPRLAYADVAEVIDSALSDQPPSCRIFLATDETAFVEFMSQRFGDRLTYRQMFRSSDGKPIDRVNSDGNYQKGVDAVVDCLLLSRTNYLIRTASNLSMFSTFFNPQMPERLLNPERVLSPEP